MVFKQKEIQLRAYRRGFHLITEEILTKFPEVKEINVGFLKVFIKHTSASLTINENADPTVRQDMEDYLNHSVREDTPYFRHTYEGSDDMPAHIKSSLLGCEITVPVQQGKLALGTWQGIMLGEHRDSGGRRTIIATLQGKAA